jgi:hypothetical protein
MPNTWLQISDLAKADKMVSERKLDQSSACAKLGLTGLIKLNQWLEKFSGQPNFAQVLNALI